MIEAGHLRECCSSVFSFYGSIQIITNPYERLGCAPLLESLAIDGGADGIESFEIRCAQFPFGHFESLVGDRCQAGRFCASLIEKLIGGYNGIDESYLERFGRCEIPARIQKLRQMWSRHGEPQN